MTEQQTLDHITDLSVKLDQALKDLKNCQKTVAFFASVIKGGEAWSDTCQEAYDSVFTS